MFDDLNPPYSTIVADPPWQYDGAGTPGTGGRGAAGVRSRPTAAAADRYSTLSADQLSVLPVRTLAATNAHLYLWVTNTFMCEGHTLARAWGFTPKTILTWVKTHQDDPARVSMKTGYYFRGATEHVIFAVRGSLPLTTTDGHPTAYLWPRIGAHSAKPPAFGDLVERCSPGPYVELFARAPRLGWDSWGKGYETTPPHPPQPAEPEHTPPATVLPDCPCGHPDDEHDGMGDCHHPDEHTHNGLCNNCWT